MQTGHWFTGKGRRFFRGLLKGSLCESDSVPYCRKVWNAAGLHRQQSHSSEVWQLLHPVAKSLLGSIPLNGAEQPHLGLPGTCPWLHLSSGWGPQPLPHLGAGIAHLWPCLQHGPQPCRYIVSGVDPWMHVVVCFQPGLCPWLFGGRLWSCVAAWSPALPPALLPFAPAWNAWMDPGPGSVLALALSLPWLGLLMG